MSILLSLLCTTPAAFTALPALPPSAATTASAVPRAPGWRREMRSGAARLQWFEPHPGRFALRLLLQGRTTAAFEAATPLEICVVDRRGSETWLRDGYQAVAPGGGHGDLIATGDLKTANGTRFRITDAFHVLPAEGGFTMTRRVSIETPSAADSGFNSRFCLSPRTPTSMRDDDFFAPGIWYRDNAHVPSKALASHQDDRYYYFREDRLPLPLILTRDKRTGVTLLLAHLGGNPATFAGEDGLNRITDARIQFGSLGIVNTDRPSPAFLFPGTEGERTYTYGGSTQANRWAYRSHPVRAGVVHTYRLQIQIARTPDFPAAVRWGWRSIYNQQPPPVIPVDLAKVYRASMDLLATYCHPYNGVISVPFAAAVPDGKVVDTSSEMGFVGQALPVAALLLRYGYETKNAGAITHAKQVVDFWAANAPTPAGLPKGWYDVHPDGTVTWRNYDVFLRIASDGLDGALQAWSIARQHGDERPEWLAFCRRYGDWLLSAQSPDGSWARAYDTEGRVRNPATDTTDQAIPFLIDLSLATGDRRYRLAALRAGAFCWRSVHTAYAYVGGTPDNPNVMDKEGGMMALAAFLALYDVTRERRWLTAAVQAADYSETWVYCWNIPMPVDDPKVVYPRNRTTYGLSLIATGHSGADDYMAGAPFLYYRLYLRTGDTHYRDLARMLLHDTKQMMDWDGTLGYAYPGLLTEALSLPPLRGHGVTYWLPWLTVCILDPLIDLRDVFGDLDIDRIEKLPAAERLRRDDRYARDHGFRQP